MLLIGGQKLRELGSSRHTDDSDYMIYDKEKEMFSHDHIKNVDYINAAKNDFFMKIWKKEKDNKDMSLNSLLELKCYSFVQHCQNMNFQKADNDEFDIKFLVRKLNFCVYFNNVKHYISDGELSEITKIINSIKRG